MAKPNNLSNLILLIFSIIIFFYSFFTGMLLWGLIVIFLAIFVRIFFNIAIYILEYIELNKKHIELSDKYLAQKMKKHDNEIKLE